MQEVPSIQLHTRKPLSTSSCCANWPPDWQPQLPRRCNAWCSRTCSRCRCEAAVKARACTTAAQRSEATQFVIADYVLMPSHCKLQTQTALNSSSSCHNRPAAGSTGVTEIVRQAVHTMLGMRMSISSAGLRISRCTTCMHSFIAHDQPNG
jgi:hypothetical protein